MQLAKSILAAAALALAGAAYADNHAKKDAEPGFNVLDKNKDGYITRAEAAPDKDLVKKFKEADANNDGKLSRVEYLKVKAAKDANTVKEKVSSEAREAKERAPGSDNKSGSSGSTTK